MSKMSFEDMMGGRFRPLGDRRIRRRFPTGQRPAASTGLRPGNITIFAGDTCTVAGFPLHPSSRTFPRPAPEVIHE